MAARPRRGIRITREGRYFIGLSFGVGLAAVNTGNNLLYLLLGILLALILTSGILSEIALGGLEVRRRLPRRAQVGKPHLVEIEVHNRKKWIPSYAIEVEDIRKNQPADKRCFFLKVSPKATQVAAYRRTPQKRGREFHIAFRIATRFPFGLFEKARILPVSETQIVYPATSPWTDPRAHSEMIKEQPRTPKPTRGIEDWVALRPMREGDDPRWIDWKKTASRGETVVRQFMGSEQPMIMVMLDDILPRDLTPAVLADWLQKFEVSVSDVASEATHHLRRGTRVILRTQSGQALTLSPVHGCDPPLRFLALVTPVGAPAPPDHSTSQARIRMASLRSARAPSFGPSEAAR